MKNTRADVNIFKKIDETKAYTYIVSQIKDLIESGALECGAKLPSETELACTFGVSRNTVREALLVLEYTGFVKISKGKATEVLFPSTKSVLNKLAGLSVKDNTFVSDLNEVRKILEPQIAYLAALRATEEEIAAMQRCLDKHRRDIDSRDDVANHSGELHALFLEACHNKTLEAMMRPINNHVVSFSRFVLGFKEQPERVLADHTAIVQEIINRNAAGAADAMKRHMESVDEFYSVL